MEVTKIKPRINPDPGSLIDSCGKKYLQNAGFRSEGINEVMTINPETETFYYRAPRIGLYETGLMMVTSLILSTLDLGLLHYVVRGESA